MEDNLTLVIGICGGSGSGKTTLIKRLQEDLSAVNPVIFTMDNYYHPIEQQVRDANGVVNFDLPTALDEAQLTRDLKQLYSGKSVEVKEYFFNTVPEKNSLLTLNPAEVILVEGLFLFHYPEVRNLVNFSIFVDVDFNTQLDRRMYRDQTSRGYKHHDIIYQWNNHVLPCYQNYIEPYKNQANVVFRNDHRAETDYVELKTHIMHLIEQQGLQC
jgi:uridine kinase